MGSLGDPGTSLDWLERPLGVDLSATDNPVTYTKGHDVGVVSFGPTTLIDQVEGFTAPGDFGAPTDTVNGICNRHENRS